MAGAARALADRLGLPLIPPQENGPPLRLLVTGPGLELRLVHMRPGQGVTVQWLHNPRLHQASAAGEGLIRAVGARRGQRPTVLDATAGLGRDAALLARRGCPVLMVERSPVLAAMLADALRRTAAEPEGAELARHLKLHCGEAVSVMAGLTDTDRPDVVCLDPMYPDTGKTAKSRKEMQLLQALLGPDPDPPGLLAAALDTARHRVVVKRPRKAPALPGPEPSHRIVGSSTRFDVYLVG
ncbi:MAG: class I SAM-dependent methyltransferase [Ectothiorhodospiraceae bacterium]|nr:class I SAM-dependent methyltransferase [Ectothiorhodospiraceae bacterium]